MSRRFLEMLNNLKVPILGIIENMTRNGEACRPCFEDPVHAMSRKYKVPVISSIPFISQIDRIIDTHSFFAALGYSKEQWSHLETDLIELAATGEAEPGQITEYGKKYEVRGIMKGPSGRVAEIISVWIILSGEDIPRFVTAYPGGKG